MDKEALNGLRGILSFHIVAFHAYIIPFPSSVPINLYAQIDMPIFFLLSGFGLAVSNGRTLFYDSNKCVAGDDKEWDTEEKQEFDYWKFYKNRCIRILPLHYLGLIAGLICWTFGYEKYSLYDKLDKYFPYLSSVKCIIIGSIILLLQKRF